MRYKIELGFSQIGLKPISFWSLNLRLKPEAIDMKAILVRDFGEPEVMKVEDVEIPSPTHKQVLVKVHAAGVNPLDTYLRTGIHAHAPKLPYTPGKDAAGVVEAIGDDVSKFEIGDRVYTADS